MTICPNCNGCFIPLNPSGYECSQCGGKIMDWDDEYAPTVDAWADQEMAYEAFMAHYSHIDVVRMSNAEFDRWQAEYKRLYDALWDAQIAYYKAIRA